MKRFIIVAFVFMFLGGVWVQASAQTKQSSPSILSRKDWGAKDPVGEAKTQKIEFITIHHTATPQKPGTLIGTKMRNLQAFSQREEKLASGKLKPVWFDIPYHYYIAVDGQIAEGRELKYVGDTNTEYDPTGHALIVLEGSFNAEQPSSAQIDSMKKMVAWLARKYKVPPANIKGHSDYAQTACPGDNLKKLLPELSKP